MGAWILMFFSNLLIPAILMAFGSILRNNAPGHINSLFGYRTSMSMKNQDTWEFANRLWGRLSFRWGLWMLIGTTAAMIALLFSGEDVVYLVGSVICCVQVILILATIPVVEHALKKEFDKNGVRRK